MKKHIYIPMLATILLSSAAIASCDSSEREPDYPEQLYLSDKMVEFDAEGGYLTIYLTSENIMWKASSALSSEWFSFSPETGATSTPIRVEAKPNTSESERVDTLIIESQSLFYPFSEKCVIRQKGAGQ